MDKIKQLEKLGFTKAASVLKDKKELARKLSIAYEHHRFVSQEAINKFNIELKIKTEVTEDYRTRYDQLIFTPLEEYDLVPPPHVLEDLEVAQEKGCFDFFEVGRIKNIEIKKDPIVFGRVKGCDDRFYISQWDDDVKIEDLIGENEG